MAAAVALAMVVARLIYFALACCLLSLESFLKAAESLRASRVITLITQQLSVSWPFFSHISHEDSACLVSKSHSSLLYFSQSHS